MTILISNLAWIAQCRNLFAKIKASIQNMPDGIFSVTFFLIFATQKSTISFRTSWINWFTLLPLLKPTGDYSIA
jgi:hypothetical protein